MKLKTIDIAIIIGVLTSLVLIVLIFPINSLIFTTPLTQAANININPNIQNGPITTGSIVNTTKIYPNAPTSNAIQNALDSAGCKNNNGICTLSSPKFLVNAQTILFDSNQVQYPSSVFVNIPTQSVIPWNTKITVPDYVNQNWIQLPKLTLLGPQGQLLDLGTVQLSLYGAVTTDTTVLVSGQFTAYLDGIKKYSANLATQGITTNKLIPLQIGNKPAFTFTFADEGSNWQDGTTHYFQIYIGNVTATVGTGQNTQVFQYTKNALVYNLPMVLNSSHKVVIGLDNKALSVFLSDVSLVTTSPQVTFRTNCGPTYGCEDRVAGGGVPDVKVYDNGFLLGSGTNIQNLPRDEQLTFLINGEQIPIKTPVTSYIYTITCFTPVNIPVGLGSGSYGITGCTSNFGWSGGTK